MPSPMPARAITSNRTPITVKITPIFVYYPRPSRVSRVGAVREPPLHEGRSHSRTTPTGCHRAAVGSHVGEEALPGACRGLQTVTVQGELVHELVHGRISVGDTPSFRDHEHLPVLQLLYVVYSLLETGAVVEQVTGGIEVLVVSDEVVTIFGGVGNNGGHLLVLCGEPTLGFCAYVGCSQRHGDRMIAWVSSGMIQV